MVADHRSDYSPAFVGTYRVRLPTNGLSAQTSAGERIGDLPHKAVHGEQAPEAIRIPLALDAGAATMAARAPAQAAMRTFIVR